MMERIRSNLSRVMSFTALVIALGGTAYAASLPRNSVGTSQIRAKAVKNSDLGDSAVTSRKIKNRSLQAADFAAGQLVAGLNGSPGRAGFRGATGPTGPSGLVAAAKARSVTAAADLPVAVNSSASFLVRCLAGEQAIGGGGRGDDLDSEKTEVTSSRPALSTALTTPDEPPAEGGAFDGWKITAVNQT